MSEETTFEALVADMDGVLTKTADLHEAAWKSTFDELLENEEGQPKFSHEDYLEHVDGKPRYEGVSDFLKSRGIELAEEPEEEDGSESVRTLGDRKNERFLEILKKGVDVFSDTQTALHRWRLGGLKTAAVSSSRNCRAVIEAAGIVDLFDRIVDGQDAHDRNLDGKAEIIRAACEELQVSPEKTVLLEDARSGVEAGRTNAMGLVVGVDRGNDASQLLGAGAHCTVQDVRRLRFQRPLPHAFDHLPQVADMKKSGRLLLFLDFDGTLSPIVDDPTAATLPRDTRAVLERLAPFAQLTIISGRDRHDVARRIGLDHDIAYAGSHGLDICGHGKRFTVPEAEQALPEVDAAEERLRRGLAGIDGAVIERKKFSVAAHVRCIQEEDEADRVRQLAEELEADTSLRLRYGKKVYELEPELDWHKGRALDWILETVLNQSTDDRILYIGDDETDEDAFAVLEDGGLGIHVGPSPSDSRAHLRVTDPEQVRELLEHLAHDT